MSKQPNVQLISAIIVRKHALIKLQDAEREYRVACAEVSSIKRASLPLGVSDLIQAAWDEYHGPITDDSGESYIPAMPPAFMRGFVDGYEAGKPQTKTKQAV